MKHEQSQTISGIVLAGGAGRRVAGRDKGLIHWHGRPLIEHVLESLRPQVDSIVISCNRNLEFYGSYGYPHVEDRRADYRGPLAGVEAALSALDAGITHCFICPCDCPTLPQNIVALLAQAALRSAHKPCYVHDGVRDQYLFALLPTAALGSLEAYLDGGQRSVRGWYRELGATAIDLSDLAHCFTNLNTLEGLHNPGYRE